MIEKKKEPTAPTADSWELPIDGYGSLKESIERIADLKGQTTRQLLRQEVGGYFLSKYFLINSITLAVATKNAGTFKIILI